MKDHGQPQGTPFFTFRRALMVAAVWFVVTNLYAAASMYDDYQRANGKDTGLTTPVFKALFYGTNASFWAAVAFFTGAVVMRLAAMRTKRR